MRLHSGGNASQTVRYVRIIGHEPIKSQQESKGSGFCGYRLLAPLFDLSTNFLPSRSANRSTLTWFRAEYTGQANADSSKYRRRIKLSWRCRRMQIENRNEFRNSVACRRPRIRSVVAHCDTVSAYLERASSPFVSCCVASSRRNQTNIRRKASNLRQRTRQIQTRFSSDGSVFNVRYVVDQSCVNCETVCIFRCGTK